MLNFIAKTAEETKNLAEGELAKAGSAIDNTKQEIGGVVNAAGSALEQTKKAANDAINQGVKAAEQALDDQVKHVEKVRRLSYISNENCLIFFPISRELMKLLNLQVIQLIIK